MATVRRCRAVLVPDAVQATQDIYRMQLPDSVMDVVQANMPQLATLHAAVALVARTSRVPTDDHATHVRVMTNVMIICDRFLLNVSVFILVMQVMATVKRCRAVLVPDSGTYTAVLVPASRSLNFRRHTFMLYYASPQ